MGSWSNIIKHAFSLNVLLIVYSSQLAWRYIPVLLKLSLDHILHLTSALHLTSPSQVTPFIDCSSVLTVLLFNNPQWYASTSTRSIPQSLLSPESTKTSLSKDNFLFVFYLNVLCCLPLSPVSSLHFSLLTSLLPIELLLIPHFQGFFSSACPTVELQTRPDYFSFWGEQNGWRSILDLGKTWVWILVLSHAYQGPMDNSLIPLSTMTYKLMATPSLYSPAQSLS